jgi:phosphoribosylformylglycinamidine synthase
MKEIFFGENVELSVIGTFPGTGRLELFYHGVRVCDLDMNFMHEGVPKITKEALWVSPKHKEPSFKCPADLGDKLREVLSDPNVCSKEAVVRRYDHEVQGAAVIKPMAGPACDGPSDAAVLRPRYDSIKGFALSNGINPRFGKIDPYWMAASCVDEAVRQIIAVGGDLRELAILDNFCWGNPDKPDRLGGLVRAAKACHDLAVAYGTPFISGKDSFYNEYTDKGKAIAIPGTLLISAIGIMEDVTRAVSMDLKETGNLIYVVGNTYPEWGGSVYLATYGFTGNGVPVVRSKEALKTFQAMIKATSRGLVRTAHDCSEGGLLAALTEMCFAGGRGATAVLKAVPFVGDDVRDDMVLFSESNSRFIVEVRSEDKAAFERVMKGVPYGMFGRVQEGPEIFVYGVKEDLRLKADVQELKAVWKKPLQF